MKRPKRRKKKGEECPVYPLCVRGPKAHAYDPGKCSLREEKPVRPISQAEDTVGPPGNRRLRRWRP